MKAISLWQPWASAIAAGLKTIETRHWATKYRGPIAIHAAKRRIDNEMAVALADHPIIASFFKAIGIDCHADVNQTFPFGAIVSVATLTDCVPTSELRDSISTANAALGNFEDGRFGWVLKQIHRIDPPIPQLGRQGIFNCDIPPGILKGRYRDC